MTTKHAKFAKQIRTFKENGGMLRTSRALKLGVHPRDLYAMKNQNVIEPLSRGLYRLSKGRPLSQPDLATVALKIPQGVLCLISALAFHKMTTQIPHEVYIALKKGAEKPRLDFPPIRFTWLTPAAFTNGVETHQVDGVTLKVYSLEKTVADCFKFRNRIGLDVALEALKFSRQRKRASVEALMRYAKVDRVDKIMKPYLEAIL
jgi:predicted transcriptional regulator of viral defense system